MLTLNQSIFKAYDIRGVVGKTLDASIARQIGHAFGSAVRKKGERTVVIGKDGRLSGPELTAALAQGLQDAGVDVIDLGVVVTPMVYFGTHVLQANSGVMVTGSHNPPDYNGFKMVLAGEAIYGDTILALYRAIVAGDLEHGHGSYRTHDLRQEYLARIVGDVKLARPMKIAVDCGNGVAGAFAGDLYRAMGCEVTELFCEVDGHFPNHHPDPAHPENLQDVIRCLQQTDVEIGLAFDGDGDRLGLVTKDGQVIYPDRQLMLFAADVLTRHAGARNPVRRQMHAPSGRLDQRARRQAADVEDRAFAGQGQDARNRRAAGRRNERAYLFQGPLVRLRRRLVCRRAHAGVVEPLGRSVGDAQCAAAIDQHAGIAIGAARRRKFRADRQAATGRRVSRRRPGCHHRRLAGRVSRWLRPGTLVEYHADRRHAL